MTSLQITLTGEVYKADIPFVNIRLDLVDLVWQVSAANNLVLLMEVCSHA